MKTVTTKGTDVVQEKVRETHQKSEKEQKKEEKQEVTMSKRQMKKVEKQKQRKLKDALKNASGSNKAIAVDHELQSITTAHARNGVNNDNAVTAAADFPVQHTNDDSVLSKRSAVALDYFQDAFLRYFVKRPTRRSPLINRGYYLRMAVITDLVKTISTFLCQRLRSIPMANHELEITASTEALQDEDRKEGKIFDENEPIQIISLGAGFDTLAFRLGVEQKDDTILSNQSTSKTCTHNKDSKECVSNKWMCNIEEKCNVFCYDVDFPAVTMNKAACMAAAPHGTFPTSFTYQLTNPKHPIASKHYNAIGADLRAEDSSFDH